MPPPLQEILVWVIAIVMRHVAAFEPDPEPVVAEPDPAIAEPEPAVAEPALDPFSVGAGAGLSPDLQPTIAIASSATRCFIARSVTDDLDVDVDAAGAFDAPHRNRLAERAHDHDLEIRECRGIL